MVLSLWLLAILNHAEALIPFLDGGKDIPKLYNGYFDSQIAKQAATAVGAAISSGKTNIEVYLPSVPNLEEVRFGCVQLNFDEFVLSIAFFCGAFMENMCNLIGIF